MSQSSNHNVEPREVRRIRAAPADRPAALELEGPALADYVGVLLGARWLIVGAGLLGLVLGAAFVWRAVPQYRSDILVQVEQKPQGLGLEGMSDLFSGKVPAETEMEIIRSRSLVGSVVGELALDVAAAPRRFPVLGAAIARRYAGDGPAPARFGLAKYGWGGERIAVSRLRVPDAQLGKPLTLVAGSGGSFTLQSSSGAHLLAGRVGAVAEAGAFSISVSDLQARPGTEFVVVRDRRNNTIENLQNALQIGEKGKNTGILSVALEGPDPERLAATLDAISHTYLRQNVERKSAEAQKTLEFLETQLPDVKAQLEANESKLEAYQAAKGSVDVSLETQAMLSRAVELEKALSELQVQRSELKHRFTDNHPAIVMLDEKAAQLQRDKASIDARFKKLPQAEMDSARLIRDAKVSQELYVLLLNKAQELRVVKSGTIGNVRILDSAVVPVEPFSPKKAHVMALALALGLALGVGLAFLRRALTRGVEDPELIERETGLSVFASIPRSANEQRLSREKDWDRVLAQVEPSDVAVESVRSLRTSLQFALIESPNNVVGVLGPAPGIGKSFCSANLATVLAESGKRVLVIDADLRKGRLHKYLGGGRENGLSDLVSGTATKEQVIRGTSIPNLDFIATGRTPPNPAGVLGSERFAAALRELASRYDFVVVDTAPVLAVTDAVLVARHCGVNLLVLRACQHPIREINAALARFEQGGARVHGAVLNDVQVRTGYGYGAYHYHYAYTTDRKKRAAQG